MADEKPPLPAEAPKPDAIAAGTPAPPPPAPAGAITAEPMPVPPIPLTPAASAKPTPVTSTVPPPSDGKDGMRELIETVVFVVVLVLMLKTFLAEAFVIPTGSMANTLLGYHYKVACPQCGYPNLVNASSEADPQQGHAVPVTSARCENCRLPNMLPPMVVREGPR